MRHEVISSWVQVFQFSTSCEHGVQSFCFENGLFSHSYHLLDVRNSPNIHFIFKLAHLYFLEDLHFDPKTLYVMFYLLAELNGLPSTAWRGEQRWYYMHRKWEAMVCFSRKHVLCNHRSQILLEDDCVAKFKGFSILRLTPHGHDVGTLCTTRGMIPDFTWSSVFVCFKLSDC